MIAHWLKGIYAVFILLTETNTIFRLMHREVIIVTQKHDMALYILLIDSPFERRY